MLNILLVEDYNIVRDGITVLLETDPDISIIAGVTNEEEALKILEKEISIHIVLTDINTPQLDGIALIKKITERFPKVKPVVLSMHDKEEYVFKAFSEGANGYLLKNVTAEELFFALKHINSGSKYLCSELTTKIVTKILNHGYPIPADFSPALEFSSREIEVLQLIAEGLTNLEMADQLFISKRTIEGHRQSLIEKTGVKNTASLIRYAVLHGIIQ